jgi:hypothetical protein
MRNALSLFVLTSSLLAACNSPSSNPLVAPPSIADASTLEDEEIPVPEVGLDAATLQERATDGFWTAPEAWPVVPIHASLMPPIGNNRASIVSWGNNPQLAGGNNPKGLTKVDRYMRYNQQHTMTNFQAASTADGDMFGAGQTHLEDGSLFVAGGSPPKQNPGDAWGSINDSFKLDFASGTWSSRAKMSEARWYPTNTLLPNGDVLVTSGRSDLPEIFQKNGTWRSLENARRSLPLYPWMHVAPDGRVLTSGPQNTMAFLNTNAGGSWTNPSTRDAINRSYGTSVMFEAGKLLVIGGGAPAVNSCLIVNMSSGTITATGSMKYARRNLNAVVLPDGQVLVLGGNTGSGSNDGAFVYSAELWNPKTGKWRELGQQTQRRPYHSTAILMPGGAVFSGGGSVAPDQDTAEFFVPPYLFDKEGKARRVIEGTRPMISSAPSEITYSQAFQITSSREIRMVSLIKPASTTHAFDMGQRRLELGFRKSGEGLTVNAPADRNLAPPGYYMLFTVDSEGVPSHAAWVKLR